MAASARTRFSSVAGRIQKNSTGARHNCVNGRVIGNNHEIGGAALRLRLCPVPANLESARRRAWIRVLDPQERERLQRLPAHRQPAFLLAHTLLRDELSLRGHGAPERIELQRGESGKPRLYRGGTRFSLSYSDHWVALVTAAGCDDLGIDIEERARLRRDPRRLARRYFAAEEARYVAGAETAERVAAFLALWTLKEAWSKARGEGLAASLPGPLIRCHGDAPGLACDSEAGRFALLRPAPGVALALCRLGAEALPTPLPTLWGPPFCEPRSGPSCAPLPLLPVGEASRCRTAG